MRSALIYQPCGLGDIFFLFKLGLQMRKEGYIVWWPVVHEFEWLNAVAPWFKFVSWGDEDNHLTRPPLPEKVNFPNKDKYDPDRPNEKSEDFWYYNGFGNYSPVMAGKYDALDIEWKDWRDYVLFRRNPDRERLLLEHLGITDGADFTLINEVYMQRPHPQRLQILVGDGRPQIHVQLIPGFTATDWCAVFERASAVHMVETSFNYILESPTMFDKMKEKELYLYHRTGNWNQTKYLFELPWNYQ